MVGRTRHLAPTIRGMTVVDRPTISGQFLVGSMLTVSPLAGKCQASTDTSSPGPGAPVDQRGAKQGGKKSSPWSLRPRFCPTADKSRIAKWARQSVKRKFRIVPFLRQIPRVQKSLVDRVPQLAGSKFMKFTDDPALKSISGPIGQAGFDDGLDDLRSCPDRFDELPVHPRTQMSRACWASGRGPFRFDQMIVHPPVPALADITHNPVHDDRVNICRRSLSSAGRPSALRA